MPAFDISADIHLTGSVQNQAILSATAERSINNLALRHSIYRFILVPGNLSHKFFSLEMSENSSRH